MAKYTRVRSKCFVNIVQGGGGQNVWKTKCFNIIWTTSSPSFFSGIVARENTSHEETRRGRAGREFFLLPRPRASRLLVRGVFRARLSLRKTRDCSYSLNIINYYEDGIVSPCIFCFLSEPTVYNFLELRISRTKNSTQLSHTILAPRIYHIFFLVEPITHPFYHN